MRTATGPRPNAVIVGVQLGGVTNAAFEASLNELARLADTLGLNVVGRITQRRASLSPAAVLGQGKLKQLADFT